MNRFIDFTDEELALKAQAGNKEAEEALTMRYFDLAGILANAFPIQGTECDDRQMEAVQGLLKAVRNWTPGRGSKFKTFAKLTMRNTLKDLYRERNQKSEIPTRSLRSIDEAVGHDDGLALVEVLAGDDDPAGEVIGRQYAIDRRAELAADQWREFVQALTEDGEAADRLKGSLKSFARDLMLRGGLDADLYGDLVELLDRSGQLGLFGMAAQPVETSDLAKDVFGRYAAAQWAILCDVAEGYEQADIAQRVGLGQPTVAQILAAVRERVGLMEAA